MFTIIKTYKSVFLGLIRSEFGRHLEGGYKNQDVTEDDNGSQLDEHVQELIKDGKIDEKDLKTLESIKGDMSKLEVQTQADLKEYLKNMTLSVLQNGFKIKGQEGVDALTRIAELTGDTELLSRINGIDFKLIDGKTIVKEENTFIVYDKEGDREGFLYNDRISTARRPWDNNDIYNDNKINIKTDKVDGDIDSILSSNETYKESNDKVKKVDKEQKAIDKHNTEIMGKMFKLLKIDISKLNMTKLDDLSTQLTIVSSEVLKIHPGYKTVHLPKIEAKIGEINAEKIKVNELVKEKSDLEGKIKLFIQNNIDEPLDQTKLDAGKEEIDALNIKLKEKGEKPIDFKKIVKPQIKDLFDNMGKIQDIQILERVTEKSNNLVKILKGLGMNPNLINKFIIKFNKKYESVKDKINQIKVIKQQTKQKKVDKIKKTSTVEPNNIDASINTAIYTVVLGDTFGKIAKRAGKSINELKSINPDIKNISKIYVGQKINIKSNDVDTSVNQQNGNKVEKNDNLVKNIEEINIKENNEKNNSFPRKLATYEDFDGNIQNIVLKDVSHPGMNDNDLGTPEYIVELDDSGKFFDPDVSFDHIPNKAEIKKAITSLLKEYNKEKVKKVEEQEKEQKLEKEEELKESKEFKKDILEKEADENKEKIAEKNEQLKNNIEEQIDKQEFSVKDLLGEEFKNISAASPEMKWLEDFNKSDLTKSISLDDIKVDLNKGKIEFTFDDSGFNENYNKGYEVTFDKDNFSLDDFRNKVSEKAKEAVKKKSEEK